MITPLVSYSTHISAVRDRRVDSTGSGCSNKQWDLEKGCAVWKPGEFHLHPRQTSRLLFSWYQCVYGMSHLQCGSRVFHVWTRNTTCICMVVHLSLGCTCNLALHATVHITVQGGQLLHTFHTLSRHTSIFSHNENTFLTDNILMRTRHTASARIRQIVQQSSAAAGSKNRAGRSLLGFSCVFIGLLWYFEWPQKKKLA